MKCFLVINQLNDPIYIDNNIEFCDFIIGKCKEKGLLEENTEVSELDANLVMQLFSPMVLSQWLLIDQIKEPCSSITCENGFRFVFKHVDDLLFIAINGDGSETEEFLHRKILVFIRFMRFLFGPVSEEIGHSQHHSKHVKWAFLRSLMSRWSEIIESEQTFLVEAVEKLNVNQMVSEKCMEILEKSVRHIQSVQDQPIQHAVLFVNSRLLALYSKRIAHELRAKDILSLMILSKTLYPSVDTEKSSHTPGSNPNPDDNSDGAEDEYHSAPTTPKFESRSRTSSLKQDERHSKSDESQGEPILRRMEEKDSQTTTGSICERNVVRNDSSADDVSAKKFDLSDNNMSLLDMFKEKYPNTGLTQEEKAVPAHHRNTSSSSQTVQVEVHNSAGEPFAQSKETNQDIGGEFVFVPRAMSEPITGCQDEIISALDNARAINRSAPPDVNKDDLRCVSENEKEFPSRSETLVHFDNLQKTESRRKVIAENPSVDETFSVHPAFLPEEMDEMMLEHDVFSLASRSSSDLSNRSENYPNLSRCGEDSPFDSSVQRSNSGLLHASGSRHFTPRATPSPYGMSESEGSPSGTPAESAARKDNVSSKDPKKNYLPQTIFLETSACLYSPYHVHTAQVFKGVTLILLAQAPRHAMADSIYQIMHNIQDLIHGRRGKMPRARGLHVYEIMNSLLGKLHSAFRKSKGRQESLSREIYYRWEREDMKTRILEYLEKDPRCPIPKELESPLWEMYKKLRELFSLLFLRHQVENPDLKKALLQLSHRFSAELLDYKEYLNVKAQRNITMTSYIDEFPGLVHFIFIDRRLHLMTAPSLNVVPKHREKADATAYIKKYIWRMYQLMMKKLMNGYTTVIMRDGDFYFSYFLWFEDSKRKPLPVQEHFKPSHKLPYPGVLCGSFYKDVIQQCFPHVLNSSVYCYEMFLMHLGNVHPHYIASHCEKLAVKMLEMSGDAYSPLNLL